MLKHRGCRALDQRYEATMVDLGKSHIISKMWSVSPCVTVVLLSLPHILKLLMVLGERSVSLDLSRPIQPVHHEWFLNDNVEILFSLHTILCVKAGLSYCIHLCLWRWIFHFHLSECKQQRWRRGQFSWDPLARNLEENFMKVREGLEDLIDVLLTQAGTRCYNTYLPLFTCIVCIFYIIYFYNIYIL